MILSREIFPPMHHAVSVELVKDKMIAVWYSASYETATDTVISLIRHDGKHWSDPETVVEFPGFGLGNPVLWKAPNGDLWLLFVVLSERDWKSSVIFRKISKDMGKTWSVMDRIFDQKGLMTKGRPLVLSNGSYVIPVYDEKLWAPMVLISENGGSNWNLHGDTTAVGVIQPNIVELDDGTLMMLSRSKMGKMYISHSFNHGFSWTSSVPTNIPNPNSGTDLVKYKKTLILAYNHSTVARNRLDLAFSYNNGLSWTNPVNLLSEAVGEYSYPCILIHDDELHVFFTYNRMNIAHESLKLEEIKVK